PTRTTCTTVLPLTCWPSTAWPTPSASAEFTPRRQLGMGSGVDRRRQRFRTPIGLKRQKGASMRRFWIVLYTAVVAMVLTANLSAQAGTGTANSKAQTTSTAKAKTATPESEKLD